MNNKMNNNKSTQKETLRLLLEEELEKDSRFANMTFEESIAKIERLRKTNNSHLNDREYALFIAYKNGLSVFNKYAKNFNAMFNAYMKDHLNKIAAKAERYHELIEMFDEVREETLFLMSDYVG